MFKAIVTNVVVSKGYDNNPALKFSGKEENCVQFRVGEKVYDPNAENNTRWVNHSVKAFGPVCERIKKMQIKEGSYVNLYGKLVEEVWNDTKTNEQKSARVIVLDDIEYISGGGKKSSTDNSDAKSSTKTTNDGKKGSTPEDSPNFEGYSSLSDGAFFGED